MTISAKVICHSRGDMGAELITMELTYPRFIHAEFMTHRMFSRNAASSRAIPVQKMIDMVATNIAKPIHWGRNKPGMQAAEELTGEELKKAHIEWQYAAYNALDTAEALMKAGAHKQIVNRILEPFMHITVICTGTKAAWANFLWLRNHPDAQPEIQELARCVADALEYSNPRQLQRGFWHLPYVREEDRVQAAEYLTSGAAVLGDTLDSVLIRISVARCARVSYLTHNGEKPSLEKDLELYDRLVGSMPLHASPAEHQASPDRMDLWSGKWSNPKLHGNLEGWLQYRKMLDGEYQTDINAHKEWRNAA